MFAEVFRAPEQTNLKLKGAVCVAVRRLETATWGVCLGADRLDFLDLPGVALSV